MSEKAEKKEIVEKESTSCTDAGNEISQDALTIEERKGIINKLLFDGYYSETCTIGDQSFLIRTLSVAETNYADDHVNKDTARGEYTSRATAIRNVKIYYLVVSFLNPFHNSNATDSRDIIKHLHSEEFEKQFQEYVKDLSVKPEIIINYLWERYNEIGDKSMRALEDDRLNAQENGKILKN